MPRFKNRRTRFARKAKVWFKEKLPRSTRRVTKRTYRRRRPMTKEVDPQPQRRSRKKGCHASVTNPTLDPLIASSASPAILGSGRPAPSGAPAYTYCIPWIATRRKPANVGNSAMAQLGTGTPYMKGLSENITISTTGAAPWQWRRVCFTFKSKYLIEQFTISQGDDLIDFNHDPFFSNGYNDSSGVFRPMYDLASYYGKHNNPLKFRARSPQHTLGFSTLCSVVAAQQLPGQPTQADYINVMTAKTDNTEVTIKYDKTVTIASGNEAGVQRNYRRYHPMNKTLVYDSLEQGSNSNYDSMSTEAKPGMGDYYVVDFFQARYLADADDGNLIFDPRATLYWHER
ncbi:capsid protein [sheep associated gemycircularvirus 1]|uniref:Capsid protein n=1 Tax=sheep associated gemycircularvirus 1 TaxID=1985412 RepID=A0A168MG69_9VIRU|nr:capsid protein [Faeces associated gemycircularvirus 16]ANC51596.1 capsid protein [Faeces associated gemycircularvirus 16]